MKCRCVLLVECESPGDHLPLVADRLRACFIKEENVIAARYDFYGDPRRVLQRAEDGRPLYCRLSDLAALHADHAILVLADASIFFDSGRCLRPWVERLQDWGRPGLLTPCAPENWDWAEGELERAGIVVVPATSEGLQAYTERMKASPELTQPVWERPDESRTDLIARLARSQLPLLDDEAPAPLVVQELLIELEYWLGAQGFAVLQALAVFPRIEPALTLHLGAALKDADGQPLLDEQRFLTLARLPWLRAGRMPDWLRLALVKGMDADHLAEVVQLARDHRN